MATQARRTRTNGGREQSSEDLSSTSVEQATGMIRQAILSGQYGPGERLKVAELSSQFGFSPMPLREALRKLEGEGLIEIEPNRGATVRRLDRHFVEDLFEINTELRVFALRRGIRMMTLEKIDVLEAIATAFEEAIARNDLETGLTLNREFHAKIVEIGGNFEAHRIFLRGWELIGAFRRRFGYGEGRQSGLAREKRMLIDAIRRQDLQLAEAIIRMQHAAATEDMLHRFREDER
ncbi:GntR family transcriptional regulator [Aquamicrobium sp. LC103]|uniref:GntR family transcriptional regulator n=1 Tax=Aquamicrobium sp. LC103 TaxID=1120658 RepID=UPI00069A2913|nr:GntR family transcriptional regulator [Aquamicrobium sp. LC103]TKT69644.1 GntR family transcriptional regulator [Aquamicrobium sp. LC103]